MFFLYFFDILLYSEFFPVVLTPADLGFRDIGTCFCDEQNEDEDEQELSILVVGYDY